MKRRGDWGRELRSNAIGSLPKGVAILTAIAVGSRKLKFAVEFNLGEKGRSPGSQFSNTPGAFEGNVLLGEVSCANVTNISVLQQQ